MKEVKTTCCYCGTGCGIIATTDGDTITAVRGDPDHPANAGRLCTKGSTLHLTMQPALQQQARLLAPEWRASRTAPRVEGMWDEVAGFVASQIAETVHRHGPDSVGIYVSGQLLTEDYYVFNKFAKGLLGTNNIDTNSRLCMSSAVAGYKQTLGADAPPACYEDIDLADLIFIVGSNTAYAHPILYRRIEEARKRNPQLKLIVADPRRTDTARDADLFLPILPGTDVALFNGLLHLCLWEDSVDLDFIAQHTEGFAELKATVRDYTPAFVAQTCGIREEDLLTAARWFGQAGAALSLYCQGLNQSTQGTAKNAALINLHLATRQIGKPGAGPFSLTGQPNAMGGREVGGLSNLLSAHRDMGNPQHRAEVARLWGVDDVPATPGKTAIEMFEAVRSGEIRILWIACTNPAQSLPDQTLVREALKKAELVIVQEAYAGTATAAFADVLLPATSWGEKEGTVTNSERRITRVNPVLSKPGKTRHDWEIVVDIAHRIEAIRGNGRTLFPYETAEQVWNEHRESTRGRDLDITGLSYALLADKGPQQWPFPEGATKGRQRLYEDGLFPTASGRARFANTVWQPVAEKPDPRFPFRLNTGRLRDQWHGMSRTGTVAQLFAHAPEPAVLMACEDMQRRFFTEGDLVEVRSRRGVQILPVQASDELRAGQAYLAMHWGDEYLGGRNALGVNGLTLPAFDPVSKQPELKHAAVAIRKVDLPWRFLAFGWVDQERALLLQRWLREQMKSFAFASVTLFGREKVGVLMRAANESAVDILAIQREFDLDAADVLSYDDKRRNVSRRVRIDNGKLAAASLAGDVAAERWLRSFLEEQRPVAELGRQLLQPSATPPQGFRERGKIVCNCFNIAATDIADALSEAGSADAAASLDLLKQRLKCGTNCGSCLPELKAMIALSAKANSLHA